jgi:hypothetical protein
MKLKPVYKNSFYASDAIEGVRIASEIKVVWFLKERSLKILI